MIASYYKTISQLVFPAGIILIVLSASGILLKFLMTQMEKKCGNTPETSKQIYHETLRETQKAVKRYTDTVISKKLFGRRNLYKNPWFLLCGVRGGGKSTLLRGTGLSFPVMYPSECDGILLETDNQIRWLFANDSVWIDSPGTIMDETENWVALVNALNKIRSGKLLDGIVLVIDINTILTAGDQCIKELASGLRNRIDELISVCGLELPVYLLFNKIDTISGFKEFFHGFNIDTVLGAKFSDYLTSSAVESFNEEYTLLCKALSFQKYERLNNEKNVSVCSMVCRFLIHFESIRNKLSGFVSELFRESDFVGRPVFRGFYFTSCLENVEQNQKKASPVESQTVTNHPFNPLKEYVFSCSSNIPEKRYVSSAFVKTLFRDAIVKDRAPAEFTSRRFRKEALVHYLTVGLICVVFVVTSVLLFSNWHRSQSLIADTNQVIQDDSPADTDLIDLYSLIEKTRNVLEKYSSLAKYGYLGTRPFSNGLKKTEELLKCIYSERVKKYMIYPAIKSLEYDIRKLSQSYFASGGRDYSDLYRSLKVYLSFTEELSGKPDLIDTAMVQPAAIEIINENFLKSSSSLPPGLETILNNNISTFLYYLKKNEALPFQQNRQLVATARKCILHIPGPDALYQKVICDLLQELPALKLENLLPSRPVLLRSSQSISVIYTAEGFEKYILDRISNTSGNLFKRDWVAGKDEESYALDPKTLRSGLLSAYLQDSKHQWLRFLGSIEYEETKDLTHAAELLKSLSAENSELSLLLNKISECTLLKNNIEVQNVSAPLLNSKIVGKIGTVVPKLIKPDSNSDDSLRIEDYNRFLNPLRTFTKSKEGLKSLENYKSRINDLSLSLLKVVDENGKNALEVFTGRESDPLCACYSYARTYLDALPSEISPSIKTLLVRPLDIVSTAASSTIEKSLNSKWQKEVAEQYKTGVYGNYPFENSTHEAPLKNIREFFRPVSGTFWGFYERTLSSYLIETPTGWKERTGSGVGVTFNRDFLQSLTSAKKVTESLFRMDGTPRVVEIRIKSSIANKNRAYLTYGSSNEPLLPGGKPVLVKWPAEKNVALNVIAGGSDIYTISSTGDWCLLKLLGASSRVENGNTAFNSRFSFNVQNMYTIFFHAFIEIPEGTELFDNRVYQNFRCTERIAGIN